MGVKGRAEVAGLVVWMQLTVFLWPVLAREYTTSHASVAPKHLFPTSAPPHPLSAQSFGSPHPSAPESFEPNITEVINIRVKNLPPVITIPVYTITIFAYVPQEAYDFGSNITTILQSLSPLTQISQVLSSLDLSPSTNSSQVFSRLSNLGKNLSQVLPSQSSLSNLSQTFFSSSPLANITEVLSNFLHFNILDLLPRPPSPQAGSHGAPLN